VLARRVEESLAVEGTDGMKAFTVVRSVADLRREVGEFRSAGRTIGMIPTMGALHQGHTSLVQGALDRGDVPVASIFVNPSQFGPNEDFAAYPRDEAGDFAKLEAAGCCIAYVPSTEVAKLTDGLCGPFRPGHFQGVATVVCKLLMMAMPDRSYFGEKDYQQLQVLKRMARDLAMPVEIVGMPTIRESDGLALSSRNRYLSPGERKTAAAIYRELTALAGKVGDGRLSCSKAAADAAQALLAAGFDKVEYLDVVDAESLAPIEHVAGPARIAVAARLGRTRLIDNVAV
jgi:pantoate--beta-alanine ligase